MTTLIAWSAYDQNGFAALHVASDSRISWGSARHRWDAGRKVFASSSTPDIWAYSGDVLFPALVLSQIVASADAGILFEENQTPLHRHAVALRSMQSSFTRRHSAPDHDFTIIHASRTGEKRAAEPVIWAISFNAQSREWTDSLLKTSGRTEVIFSGGSGNTSLKKELLKWRASDIGGTSRSIYSAFCKSIASGSDPLSGGAPQLASLYPAGAAKTVGVIHNRMLYLHGLPLEATEKSNRIEWFDNLFQRTDPATLTLADGAARHAAPKLI